MCGIVARLWPGHPKNLGSIPPGNNNFSLLQSNETRWVLPILLSNRQDGAQSPEVKMEREANHLLLFHVKIRMSVAKNSLSIRLHSRHRSKFA
jgi:predicted neuraminidase